MSHSAAVCGPRATRHDYHTGWHYSFPNPSLKVGLCRPVLVDEQVFGAVDVDQHGDDVVHALRPGRVADVGVHWLRGPCLGLAQGECVVLLLLILLLLHSGGKGVGSKGIQGDSPREGEDAMNAGRQKSCGQGKCNVLLLVRVLFLIPRFGGEGGERKGGQTESDFNIYVTSH